MNRHVAKLAFAHRKIWQSDPTYRAAVLLGPPPAIGFVVGAAIWAVLHGVGTIEPAQGWAVASSAALPNDRPRTEAPLARLPPVDTEGGLQGFTPGWLGSIHHAEVTPTLDVKVEDEATSGFMLNTSSIGVEKIIEKAPTRGISVGIEGAALAVRDAGRTTLALRLDRSDGATANCLLRMAINGHRIVSSYEINLAPFASKTLDPVSLELQPGLYSIAIGFGCWREQQMVGSARLSVLIRRPGEPSLHSVGPDEILRPISAGMK